MIRRPPTTCPRDPWRRRARPAGGWRRHRDPGTSAAGTGSRRCGCWCARPEAGREPRSAPGRPRSRPRRTPLRPRRRPGNRPAVAAGVERPWASRCLPPGSSWSVVSAARRRKSQSISLRPEKSPGAGLADRSGAGKNRSTRVRLGAKANNGGVGRILTGPGRQPLAILPFKAKPVRRNPPVARLGPGDRLGGRRRCLATLGWSRSSVPGLGGRFSVWRCCWQRSGPGSRPSSGCGVRCCRPEIGLGTVGPGWESRIVAIGKTCSPPAKISGMRVG